LEAALRLIQRRGLDWPAMTHDNFAIPHLARSLGEVSRELEDGCGLVFRETSTVAVLELPQRGLASR
jgi:hypothetical protein